MLVTSKNCSDGQAKKSVRQALNARLTEIWILAGQKVRDVKGQGTTEYAILVGVLVVIAIIAVVAFKGKLQELWTSISTGINSLS